jgi:hypothetical protein
VKSYDCGISKLNYDQIESAKAHPVVMECRGLILSYPHGEVVARSFDRFFNYGEVPVITSACRSEQLRFLRKGRWFVNNDLLLPPNCEVGDQLEWNGVCRRPA